MAKRNPIGKYYKINLDGCPIEIIKVLAVDGDEVTSIFVSAGDGYTSFENPHYTRTSYLTAECARAEYDAMIAKIRAALDGEE